MKSKLFAAAMLLAFMLTGCGAPTPSADTPPTQGIADASGDTPLRVAALKGATSMGLVGMMQDHADAYTFTMYTSADEVVPLLAKGEVDIALVPANLAAILYQKTQGGVRAIDVNTLGVLELVTGNESIPMIEDIAGKKLYMTGKGTTPEYALQHVLALNGMTPDQIEIEFKTEPTEVVAALVQNPDAIGLLPQPFATVATAQNEALKITMHLGEEWANAATDGSELVTGVTIARTEIDETRLAQFLKDHAASVAFVNENPEKAAMLIEQAGIVKAPIAQKAIPTSNLVCLTGEEMHRALSGYLQTLHSMSPDSVGGKLPDETFYYMG